MTLEKAHNIHFVGIGGIGTSSLAQILHAQGKKISGSDQNKSSITKELEKSGIKFFHGHDEKYLPESCDLVIFSPAIPKNNPEIKQAKKLKIKTISYPQALGELSKSYYTIAIAGTHGKSTTTAMLAKIAKDYNLDPTVVVGTKVKQLNKKNYLVGKSKFLILEACEYKESFLNIHPNLLVITNIEPDHLDYFKTEANYFNVFKKLIKNLPKDGIIVINKDLKPLKEITKGSKLEIVEWSIKDLNKVNVKLKIPGDFNIRNAQNAATAAQVLNIPNSAIEKSLKSFSGTWRRMEHKHKKGYQCQFIDDYGHHPTEIKATLKAIKESNPGKKILTIFQPHQYNRTKLLLKDFAKSFIDTTKVVIPNIYKVRDNEADLKSISAQKLVDEINKKSKNAINGKSLKETAEYIKKNHTKYDIVVTMGAGDITIIYKYL